MSSAQIGHGSGHNEGGMAQHSAARHNSTAFSPGSIKGRLKYRIQILWSQTIDFSIKGKTTPIYNLG